MQPRFIKNQALCYETFHINYILHLGISFKTDQTQIKNDHRNRTLPRMILSCHPNNPLSFAYPYNPTRNHDSLLLSASTAHVYNTYTHIWTHAKSASDRGIV